MAQKIKLAGPYLLILILVALLIGFNSWDVLYGGIFKRFIAADTQNIATTVNIGGVEPTIKQVNVYGTGVTTITLIEDSSIDIMATAYIDDANGCTDVRDNGGVEAIFYAANQYWVPGVGTTCSFDYNNCITGAVTSCSYQECNGTTATYECWASSAWQYYADASAGSTASVTNGGWEVVVWASDSSGTVESSSADDFAPTASNQAEVQILDAMAMAAASQSVAYSNSIANSDSTIAERGARNSGNRGINVLIAETEILLTAGNPGSQMFSNFSFSLTPPNGTSLSASSQELDLALPQRTDPAGPTTASISDDQIFWGLHVPLGTAAGNYAGTTQYTSTAD